MAFESVQYLSSLSVPQLDDFIGSLLPDTQYKLREQDVEAYSDAPAEANIFPSGLNLMEDMDLLCPLRMSLVLYAGIPSELDVLEGPATGGGEECFSGFMATSSPPSRLRGFGSS